MSGQQGSVSTARSYYGRPVLKEPTWKAADIAGYLFLGGLAGASAVLGAGSDLTGRPQLARASKCAAAGAITLSTAALVHDLGRPSRFVNMLRVFKPTSPMSVGSWLLAGFGPAAAVAAATDLTGLVPRAGRAAGLTAAVLGAAVSSYTAVLVADTAVPAWHDAHRVLPFVFVGSSTASAGGFGLLAAPPAETAPARRAAVAGALAELVTVRLMRRRAGMVAEAYESGRAGRLMKIAEALTVSGAAGAAVGSRRSRAVGAASGLALLAGSALTRLGIFEAGRASARDPKFTVEPQRERAQAGRLTGQDNLGSTAGPTP